MNIDNAIEIVAREWDAQGACASCGYHAALSEYEPLAESIYIDMERGRIELACLCGDSAGHRGVRIYFGAKG